MAGNATGYQNEVLYTSLIMTDTEGIETVSFIAVTFLPSELFQPH